jgi:hypothetical protein
MAASDLVDGQHPVDQALSSALTAALDSVISTQLTDVEAAKARLVMLHPSEHLQELIGQCHSNQLELLEDCVVLLLNAALYSGDES